MKVNPENIVKTHLKSDRHEETTRIAKIMDELTDAGDVFIMQKVDYFLIFDKINVIDCDLESNNTIIEDLIDLRDNMVDIINNLEYKMDNMKDELNEKDNIIYELERKFREYE